MIGVDAMGGDFGPDVMVPAIIDFSRRKPDVNITIYGNSDLIQSKVLSNLQMSPNALSIIGTENDIVDNDGESPLRLLAKGKNSSIVKGTESVASGEIDGYLSRGNTGALIVASKRNIGTIVDEGSTALSVWMPRMEGPDALLMDVGAEVNTTVDHLLNNASMGDAYLQRNHGIELPNIALINLGEESYKGDQAYKDAHKQLKEIYGERFVGNIEPNNILLPKPIDLLISGGKVGNAVLKSMEGTFQAMSNEIKAAAFGNQFDRIINFYAGWKIKRRLSRYNPDNRPDGTIHGINGKVVKVHGSAGTEAVRNGLIRMVEDIAAEKNKEA